MRIDFHTHILPGIDDGAVSAQMSCEMLARLSAQQVDLVVLTPHYYSHHKPIAEFVQQQHEAYNALCSQLSQPHPALRLGAEVYFSDYLFNNKDLSLLCIEGTRVMLLELPYNKTIDERMIDKVDRLIGEYGITPVLAHVERYPSLLRSPRTLERLLDFGCVLQVNLSSFTAFGSRRLINMLQRGYFGAFGTDAHNVTTRPADYVTGYSRLEKKVSNMVLKDVQHSMADLLRI